MTNGDLIRMMGDEELAELMTDEPCPPLHRRKRCPEERNCLECWAEWLKMDAEETGNMKQETGNMKEMEKTEFTPGPYRAVIEDHPMCDTGEYYTSFCIEAEKEGKKRTFAQVFPFRDNEDEAEATARIAFLTQIRKVLAKARGETGK